MDPAVQAKREAMAQFKIAAAKFNSDVNAYNSALAARRSAKANIEATFKAAIAAAKTPAEKKAANAAAKAASAALPAMPPKPVKPVKP
jgi:hypothetical protein